MKRRRTLINLLAAFALLAQGAAWAAIAPDLHQSAQTGQSMPCHDPARASKTCCGDHCNHCADVCGGHAAVMLPAFCFAATERVGFQPAAVSGLRLSVNHHERLRPPIALQS